MSIEHLYTSVFCTHCGHTVAIPVYCHNRFCPVCSVHRNRLIRYKLKTFISDRIPAKYDSFKFLTLTIANQSDPKQMTTELIKSFRRLRQRSVWRKHVRGGACIIEVKPGKEGWHVHLHTIIESSYIPFALLLTEWKAVSTGQGVYIKKLHQSQIVSYLTKYLTKDQLTTSEQKAITVVLKGVRLFQPFGTWHSPINAIKRLRFECPECANSCWGFGDRSRWFEHNTIKWTADKRELDDLPSLNSCQQECLLPEDYLMTGCQR